MLHPNANFHDIYNELLLAFCSDNRQFQYGKNSACKPTRLTGTYDTISKKKRSDFNSRQPFVVLTRLQHTHCISTHRCIHLATHSIPQHSEAAHSCHHNDKNQKPKETPDDFSRTPKEISKELIDTSVVYQRCHASTRGKAIKEAKRQEKG